MEVAVEEEDVDVRKMDVLEVEDAPFPDREGEVEREAVLVLSRLGAAEGVLLAAADVLVAVDVLRGSLVLAERVASCSRVSTVVVAGEESSSSMELGSLLESCFRLSSTTGV